MRGGDGMGVVTRAAAFYRTVLIFPVVTTRLPIGYTNQYSR